MSRNNEYLRQNSKDKNDKLSPKDSDPISNFGVTEKGDFKHCVNLCQQGKCFSPKCDQISADILGLWPEAVSPSASEKCSFWIKKISNLSRRSSCLSIKPSFESHTSRRLSNPSELSRMPSFSILSSSYTSWTKPIAGNKVSDSCFPASSILDKYEEDVKPGDIFHQNRATRKLRRRSSADTSKDIDDIDDFELDSFDDCDITDEDNIVFTVHETIEEGKDKRLSGIMSSPDLAYGSMNGSLDHSVYSS